MILGTIGSLGSGVAGPLMTYLFGDTFNDFTGVTEENVAVVKYDLANATKGVVSYYSKIINRVLSAFTIKDGYLFFSEEKYMELERTV